jgi:hypothetical protein
MRTLILSALISGALLAQTKAPATAPALPANWYGAFASYDSSSSPGLAAGATEASLLSQGAQVYSYNSWDVTLIKQPKGSAMAYTYQSSPRTGMAMILRTMGPISIIGFGNLGVATAGQNASLATSGGGVVLIKLGKTTPWSLFAGAHVLNTGALGGTKTIPEFGIGRSF